MVARAVESVDRLDIDGNNAGTAETKHFITDAPGRLFEEQMEVHVPGTLRVTREAWPHLIASGSGRVLMTSSATAIGGRSPDGWDMSYPVAKAALLGVTLQLAGAGSEHGIVANAIMPWAASPMVKAALAGSELGAWIESKAGREKVAAAALFLLHPDRIESGQFFSTASGRMARMFYALAPGYFNPDLTPEDVRDNWSQIVGESEGDAIKDAIEVQGMEHEFALLRNVLAD